MKHVVIVAHPNPKSFTMTMAHAYMDAAQSAGHKVILRDLYREKFDPILPLGEIPSSDNFCLDPIIEAEHNLLSQGEVFVFLYPFWLNAPPAIMKGYMERVFCMGFAYESTPYGNKPLLSGRSMISITSSGAHNDWLIESGGIESACKLFDDHFAAVCGLNIIDHLHFGGVVPEIRHDIVVRHIAQVRDCYKKNFAG